MLCIGKPVMAGLQLGLAGYESAHRLWEDFYNLIDTQVLKLQLVCYSKDFWKDYSSLPVLAKTLYCLINSTKLRSVAWCMELVLRSNFVIMHALSYTQTCFDGWQLRLCLLAFAWTWYASSELKVYRFSVIRVKTFHLINLTVLTTCMQLHGCCSSKTNEPSLSCLGSLSSTAKIPRSPLCPWKVKCGLSEFSFSGLLETHLYFESSFLPLFKKIIIYAKSKYLFRLRSCAIKGARKIWCGLMKPLIKFYISILLSMMVVYKGNVTVASVVLQ